MTTKETEKTKEEWKDECICYDGDGVSTCGFPCPVHAKNKENYKLKDREFFEAELRKDLAEKVRGLRKRSCIDNLSPQRG